MERIEKLRRHALEVKINNDEWAYYYAKGFREGCKESEFLQLRYAHAVRYMLSHVSPAIDEGELIVGKPSNRALTETEAEEKQSILKALKASGGHRRKAAEMLHIDPSTLYRKMKKYGLLDK